MTPGKRIRRLRQHAGLSQSELASRLHVTRQAVTKWENDNGLPDIVNLQGLAGVFDTTVDAIIGRETNEGSITLKRFDPPLPRWKRGPYDQAVRSEYPDAVAVWVLAAMPKLTRLEWWLDWIRPGLIRMVRQLQHEPGTYYLVNRVDRQVVVKVARTQMTSRVLDFTFAKRWHDLDGHWMWKVRQIV